MHSLNKKGETNATDQRRYYNFFKTNYQLVPEMQQNYWWQFLIDIAAIIVTFLLKLQDKIYITSVEILSTFKPMCHERYTYEVLNTLMMKYKPKYKHYWSTLSIRNLFLISISVHSIGNKHFCCDIHKDIVINITILLAIYLTAVHILPLISISPNVHALKGSYVWTGWDPRIYSFIEASTP